MPGARPVLKLEVIRNEIVQTKAGEAHEGEVQGARARKSNHAKDDAPEPRRPINHQRAFFRNFFRPVDCNGEQGNEGEGYPPMGDSGRFPGCTLAPGVDEEAHDPHDEGENAQV